MNSRTPDTCTVAGCRRPAVGFVHKRGTIGEAPEVYVGVPQAPGDMAICADHLPSVMDNRGPRELLSPA